MRHMRRLLALALVLVFVLALVFQVQAQGTDGQTTHTVKVGENLSMIARQYNTTVQAIAQANNITNPNVILIGQVLNIPTGATVTPTPGVPLATPVPPPQEIVRTVQPGENLFRIALQYNLTPAYLAAYNGIANPSLIIAGTTLRIPVGGQAQVVGTATPVPTQVSDGQGGGPTGTLTPIPNTASNVNFAYGVQVHLPNQDTAQIVGLADDLGVSWIKQQIEWSLYEPAAGAINFEPIDEMIDAMDAAGLNILLTVSSAPDWARDTTQESGPPRDYQTYANFVAQLASRYGGRVDAYEIWNEPNLRREWNTPRGLSANNYVELLGMAYRAIKTADSDAVVLTAGLAPTGFNDGVNAIDDRVYLRQMYAAGVAAVSDAIGAHPNGWANPPDSECCGNNRPAVDGWDDHPSFFFKQTIEDYREIMIQNDDRSTFIWATEFGWGSSDGLGIADPIEGYGFVTFTSMDEQAQYILRAFQYGRESNFIGPMILWNLNFCSVVGVTGEQCYWSLLDPANNPRPAYLAVEDIEK